MRFVQHKFRNIFTDTDLYIQYVEYNALHVLMLKKYISFSENLFRKFFCRKICFGKFGVGKFVVGKISGYQLRHHANGCTTYQKTTI